jgi:hypothetical protein
VLIPVTSQDLILLQIDILVALNTAAAMVYPCLVGNKGPVRRETKKETSYNFPFDL